MNALQRLVRTIRASRLYGRASRLADRGRHREALDLVDASLAALPPERTGGSLGAAAFSIRLSALVLRSRAAASAGDVPLAVAAIQTALPLWKAAGAPAAERFRTFVEWEAWAREYLARQGREP